MPKGTAATKYWHRTADGRVQCDVCPRACRLHEGQRGFCFVRMRQDDEIVLTTYGRSSGFCVNPIEKKPLNHFLPESAVLTFGTVGCNLGCRFCQNWDISKSRETDTLADQATPAAIARAAAELDCHSVAFSYNDPVIFLECAMDVADVCCAWPGWNRCRRPSAIWPGRPACGSRSPRCSSRASTTPTRRSTRSPEDHFRCS